MTKHLKDFVHEHCDKLREDYELTKAKLAEQEKL